MIVVENKTPVDLMNQEFEVKIDTNNVEIKVDDATVVKVHSSCWESIIRIFRKKNV